MAIISLQSYCALAGVVDPASGHGYAALPAELLAAEQSLAQQNPPAAFAYNKILCRTLLEQFTPTSVHWVLPEQFHSLYHEQLLRIESCFTHQADSYFSLSNDLFRKDLAILRYRLIPCGAEFAMPFSGISRSLLFRGGWRQAGRFIRIMAFCRGVKPFLELHMHPQCTAYFNPQGWIETYENLADFLAVNSSFLGVQSTSWFLDPALEEVSPHLAYLRQVPERCGAAILFAGMDDSEESGAFATSQSRRAQYLAGHYRPRLYTRIWLRQLLLQRNWRSVSKGSGYH